MARRGGKQNIADAIAGATPPPPPPRAGAPEWLGKQFEMRPGAGLFKKALKPDQADMWICAPFQIEAETRDVAGLAWGVLISWRDRDNQLHKETFSRALFVGECSELRARLANAGFSLNPSQAARQAFAEFFNFCRTDARAISVSSTGWHDIDSKMIYVLRDQVFGTPAEQVVLQTLESSDSPYGVSGTAMQWRQEVGLLCQGNSRLVFCSSCGFAGPLLKIVELPGGGFNIEGHSGSGKTNCLRVAASVCGGSPRDGASGYFRSWRATANGLEGVAVEHNDGLLCLDEIGVGDAREAGETIYAIANGIAKVRAHRLGGARSVARWRLLILSTGEIGISAKNAEAGKRTHAGQEVRLVDIPADAGMRMGVVEQTHGFESSGDLIKEIEIRCRQYYGAPLRAFLVALVAKLDADRDGFIARTRERVAQLARGWMRGHEGASGQVMNVATRFAVVAIAGELATAEGLTGWSDGEAAEAAKICFDAYLGQRGTVGAREDEQAVDQLLNFVSKHAAGRFDAWRELRAAVVGDANPEASPPVERGKTLQRVGWRRWDRLESAEWGYRYFLTPTGLNEALAGLSPNDARQALARRGLIVAPRGKENAAKGVLSATYNVPGEGKVRLYQLADSIMSAAGAGE